jgi:hypothetical protein
MGQLRAVIQPRVKLGSSVPRNALTGPRTGAETRIEVVAA